MLIFLGIKIFSEREKRSKHEIKKKLGVKSYTILCEVEMSAWTHEFLKYISLISVP